jgi:uncharacterized membrane protein
MNKKNFLIEIITGILGVVFVLFFGAKGIAVLALYAISPFLREKKEKSHIEKLSFHKTNSITFAVVSVFLFFLFFTQDLSLFTNNSILVKDVWFYLFVAFTLFAHGIIGFIIFKTQKE